jgi:hypothetical protein
MGLQSLLGSPQGLLVLIVAAYLLHSALWPYKDCPRCRGSKKLNSPGGAAYRKCPRCKGSGTEFRTGRRILGFVGSRRRR